MWASGPSGPFPDLYDPVWFPEKLRAAGGETPASVASVAGILLLSVWARPRRSAAVAARSSEGPAQGPVLPGERGMVSRRINHGNNAHG
jgi:hypothetical protein